MDFEVAVIDVVGVHVVNFYKLVGRGRGMHARPSRASMSKPRSLIDHIFPWTPTKGARSTSLSHGLALAVSAHRILETRESTAIASGDYLLGLASPLDYGLILWLWHLSLFLEPLTSGPR